MEVQFSARERQISAAAATLRDDGISDGQLTWSVQHVDRDAVEQILNGGEPAWREFVRRSAATECADERRAYVGLAATPPARLRDQLGIEHRKGFWSPGRVKRLVRDAQRHGIDEAALEAAVERVGLRATGEALASKENFGWLARGGAMRAQTRELGEAYVTLASAEVRRVREAMFARAAKLGESARAELEALVASRESEAALSSEAVAA
jgi:hypothetical protein